MPHTTPKFWNQPAGLKAKLLWPVSMVYLAGRTLHKTIQQKTCYWPTVPVVSVGNITMGGAGKTPVVHKLAEYFAQQGEQVAILSRGYGGENTRPHRVTPEDTAQTVGDEPTMLFQKLVHTSVHIWVGRNRKAIAKRGRASWCYPAYFGRWLSAY